VKRVLIVLSFALTLCAGRLTTDTSGLLRLTAKAETQSGRPGPRLGHCLVYDEWRGQIVLLGGYQPPNQPVLEEVWTWDGLHWELQAGVGPTARTLAGAAFDSRRKCLVFFGGIGDKATFDDVKGDTWEWDGTWRQMADISAGTRDHHVLAYDGARGRTVRYGGQMTSRAWDKDTWQWDGDRWSKIATSGPGGRAHFAMAYDTKRKKVVLFGGLGDDDKYHNDTWEWDGSVWRQVSQDGPPPRARHRMAYDSRTGVVILFGGDGVKTEPDRGFRLLGDTWIWDGRRWTEIRTTGPANRFMHAMAYDAARAKAVLYGGGDGQRGFDDTWEWDGRRWTRCSGGVR
jgi:hypothetical protein